METGVEFGKHDTDALATYLIALAYHGAQYKVENSKDTINGVIEPVWVVMITKAVK